MDHVRRSREVGDFLSKLRICTAHHMTPRGIWLRTRRSWNFRRLAASKPILCASLQACYIAILIKRRYTVIFRIVRQHVKVYGSWHQFTFISSKSIELITILISCIQKIILVEDKISNFVSSYTIHDISCSLLTYIYSFQYEWKLWNENFS